jgi:hypothetical protein
MTSVPHPLPSRISQHMAALFGHADDTLIAWQRACVQAAESLRPQPDSARLAKALALAQDGAVIVEDDGSATVQGNGPAPYTVRGGLCDCPDAQKRGLPCKHALAVQIHQQAAALLMPNTSAALQPPQLMAKTERSAPPRRSAGWDVHEAPISSCLKLRLGPCEWIHTVRASDEAELRARFQEFRTLVHDMAAELNDLALHLEAAHLTLREALEHKRAEAPATPAAAVSIPEAVSQVDLQALLQQAVQQALTAHMPANGQRPSAPPPALATPSPGAELLCPLHHVPMERKHNERGAWSSHLAYDDLGEYFCKGKGRVHRTGR